MAGYDLNMMSQEPGTVSPPLAFGSTRCSGVVKLAQRVLVLLLKNEAAATWSKLGTSFGDLIKGANLPQLTDLDNRCAMAAADVAEAIKTYQDQAGTTDAEERLESLRIKVDSAFGDSAQVSVVVTNEAGTVLQTTIV